MPKSSTYPEKSALKNKIFISHASPEDNEFSIWLFSRLTALGYNVWIDKNRLLGGERFWEEIDQTIRNDSIKFILVYSKNICRLEKPGILKDGISKEFSLASTIGIQDSLQDFIFLLNIDESPPNLFIDAPRLNQIPFYDNWAKGLSQLIKKLEKDNVPKNQDRLVDGLTNWFENKYVTEGGVKHKFETYYTTYWPIEEMPEKLYLFQYKSEEEAIAVSSNKQLKYPISKISNILASFCEDLPNPINDSSFDVSIIPKRTEIEINKILSGFESDIFPTHRDASNHFKSLLRRTFHLMMKARGLYWYDLANKKQAYFYVPGIIPKDKVSFRYPHSNIRKTKSLIGKYLSIGKWHYAISNQVILSPVLGFSLKSHLIFTTNGFLPIDDKEKMHSLRRAKSKFMFNEEWRDLLLAFLYGLKDNAGNIEIQLNESSSLKMKSWPLYLEADFGYTEPKDKTRQNVLTETETEETDEVISDVIE